ncbi:unnamed protein product [Ectocarpus sp. CCAP 1310/34]|nr:unnamed protein product [Ectocarpus sp. CCAP 1310/34]
MKGAILRAGKHVEAEPLYERSQAIPEKVLGPQHPDLRRCSSYGRCCWLITWVADNLSTVLTSRCCGPTTLSVMAYDRSNSCSASMYLPRLSVRTACQGKYAKAEPLYERSQTIPEKMLGAEHPDVATVLKNEHQAIPGKVLGPEHPGVATVLEKRALIVGRSGKVLGPEHPGVATVLEKRALIVGRSAARPTCIFPGLQSILHASARTLRPSQSTSGHRPYPIRCLVQSKLTCDGAQESGVLLANQGKDAEAEPIHDRSQAIQEKVHGPEQPDGRHCSRNERCCWLVRLYQKRWLVQSKLTCDGAPDWAFLLANQGKDAEAEPLYERSQAIQEKVLGPEQPDMRRCSRHGVLLANQGKDAEAEPLYERSQAIQEKVLGPEQPDLRRCSRNGRYFLANQGKDAEAEPLYERSQAIQEKVLGPEQPDLRRCSRNGRYFLANQGKDAEAEPLYERSQAIQEKVPSPEQPDSRGRSRYGRCCWLISCSTAMCLPWHAVRPACQGKDAEAEPLYEQSQAIQEKVLGPEQPVMRRCSRQGVLLANQGKDAEAEPLYERSQAMQGKVLGSEQPDVRHCLRNGRYFLANQGKDAEAEPLYERSQAIQEKVLGPEQPDLRRRSTNGRCCWLIRRCCWLISTLSGLACDRSNTCSTALCLPWHAVRPGCQGKDAEAEPLYERSQAMQGKVLGSEQPDVRHCLRNGRYFLANQGKDAEAEPLYEQSQAIPEKVLGPEQPDMRRCSRHGVLLANQALLLANQGKDAEAAPLYERSQAIQEKVLGSEQPDVRHCLRNGRYFLANQAIQEKVLGPEQPVMRRCSSNGRYSLANQAIQEKVLGPEQPVMRRCSSNGRYSLANQVWALMLANQGKDAEAEPLYERSQAIQEKVLGPEQPDLRRRSTNGRCCWLISTLSVVAYDRSSSGSASRYLPWLSVRTACQGKYAEPEPLYEQSQAITEKVLGPEHPDVATVLKKRCCWLISTTERHGKYVEAEPLYERSQAMTEKVIGPEQPDLRRCSRDERCCWLISTLSVVAYDRSSSGSASRYLPWLSVRTACQGKYAEPEPLYEQSQAITEKVLGPEHPDVATVLKKRCCWLISTTERHGKYVEAEPLYERSQAMTEKVIGPEQPDLRRCSRDERRCWLISTTERQGKYVEAEPLYERSQAIQEKGKYVEAEPLYERSQAIQEKAITEKVLGPEHPDVATVLKKRCCWLISTTERHGKYVEAEPLYERSQAMTEKVIGPEQPDLRRCSRDERCCWLISTLSVVAYDRSSSGSASRYLPWLSVRTACQGKYAEPEPLYEQSQAITEKVLGPEHPDVATVLKKRCCWLIRLAIPEKVLGPEHPDLRRRSRYGRCCWLISCSTSMCLPWHAVRPACQGKDAEAEPLYERSKTIPEEVLGPEHPDVATALKIWAIRLLDRIVLALACSPSCMDAKAEPLYERPQAIQEKVLGPEQRDLRRCSRYGRCCWLISCSTSICLPWHAIRPACQGKDAEAEPLYERSKTIPEKVLGPEHPDLATVLKIRALIVDQSEQPDLRRRSRNGRCCWLISCSTSLCLPWHALRPACQGKDAEAEPLYERSKVIPEKVLGPEHPDLATVLKIRAHIVGQSGNLSTVGTSGCSRPSTLSVMACGRSNSCSASMCLLCIWSLKKRALILSESEQLYERSQAITAKVIGPEHPDVATVLKNRALLLAYEGKDAEAEPLYERSQAIQEKGNDAAAEPLYERSQAIPEKVLGPEQPDLRRCSRNERCCWLISTAERQGKCTKAEQLYERSQAIPEKVLGPEHPNVATVLKNRAFFCLMSQWLGLIVLALACSTIERQGKYAEAEPLHERSQAIREKVLDPENPEVATVLKTRACSAKMYLPWLSVRTACQGKGEEAEPLHERSQAIREKVLGPENPEVATVLKNRALMVGQSGHNKEGARSGAS